ncbi:MAG: hypothetical protein FWD13_04750 [Treponema sp.]|nr:hypothetical protein [Treponema sp.]
MSGKKKIIKVKIFKLWEICALVIFVFIAVLSLDMFRRDILQTINLQNVEPVGTVVVKKNTVQRRISDRVLWDRLAYESPVYIGDLIRIAEISAAMLYIQDNSIDLEENTLIRIMLSPDGEGLQIILSEGALSVVAGAESRSLALDLKGQQVVTGPGAVVSAAVRNDGRTSVQVNEGAVQFIAQSGIVREIPSGAMVVMDASGTERQESSVVVLQPSPNVRLLNNSVQPLTVNFSWNRINLNPDDLLRLEISADRHFTRITNTVDGLDNQAQVRIDIGAWYWRLCRENTVLRSGNLTIADSTALELRSPALNSVFRYQDNYPVLNFQWTTAYEATSYVLEVSSTPDFADPIIRRNTTSAFHSESSLGDGVWYWRVMPVFPDVFGGGAVFTKAAYFRIEHSASSVTAAQNISFSQWLAAETPPVQAPPGVPLELQPPPPPPPPVVRAPEPAPAPAPAPRPPVQPPAEVLLAVPQNLRPANGTRIGITELQVNRAIVFNWNGVQGANAYILTLYQQTATGRRQVTRATITSGTSYTLSDLRLLDRGTFIWQIEAVDMGRNNAIQRRGRVGESNFVIDFPAPRPVQIEDTGILYGN